MRVLGVFGIGICWRFGGMLLFVEVCENCVFGVFVEVYECVVVGCDLLVGVGLLLVVLFFGRYNFDDGFNVYVVLILEY